MARGHQNVSWTGLRKFLERQKQKENDILEDLRGLNLLGLDVSERLV